MRFNSFCSIFAACTLFHPSENDFFNLLLVIQSSLDVTRKCKKIYMILFNKLFSRVKSLEFFSQRLSK